MEETLKVIFRKIFNFNLWLISYNFFIPYFRAGHRGRRFEDSTLGSESDARIFSDDDDRSRFDFFPLITLYCEWKIFLYMIDQVFSVSTSTDITSVSRQHHANAYRKRREYPLNNFLNLFYYIN